MKNRCRALALVEMSRVDLHHLVDLFAGMVCPNGHKGDAALGDGYIASLELFPGLGVVGLQVTHVSNVSLPQSLVLDAVH